MPAVRSVSLGIWVTVGSRDESPEQAGAAHYLEHLLFKGTRRRSAAEIAEAFDAVGGELVRIAAGTLVDGCGRSRHRVPFSANLPTASAFSLVMNAGPE